MVPNQIRDAGPVNRDKACSRSIPSPIGEKYGRQRPRISRAVEGKAWTIRSSLSTSGENYEA